MIVILLRWINALLNISFPLFSLICHTRSQPIIEPNFQILKSHLPKLLLFMPFLIYYAEFLKPLAQHNSSSTCHSLDRTFELLFRSSPPFLPVSNVTLSAMDEKLNMIVHIKLLDKQNQMQIWLLFGWFLLFINQIVCTVVATVNDCNVCYCIYQTIFLYTIKSQVKLNLKHFHSFCLLVQNIYIIYHNSKAHKIKQKPKQIEKYKVCLDLICYNLVVINTW